MCVSTWAGEKESRAEFWPQDKNRWCILGDGHMEESFWCIGVLSTFGKRNVVMKTNWGAPHQERRTFLLFSPHWVFRRYIFCNVHPIPQPPPHSGVSTWLIHAWSPFSTGIPTKRSVVKILHVFDLFADHLSLFTWHTLINANTSFGENIILQGLHHKFKQECITKVPSEKNEIMNT